MAVATRPSAKVTATSPRRLWALVTTRPSPTTTPLPAWPTPTTEACTAPITSVTALEKSPNDVLTLFLLVLVACNLQVRSYSVKNPKRQPASKKSTTWGNGARTAQVGLGAPKDGGRKGKAGPASDMATWED